VGQWCVRRPELPARKSGDIVSYAPGDTVVHPRHGVARIAGTVSRDLGTACTDYFELEIVASSMKILVPVETVEEVGIRQLPTKEEAAAILGVLASPADVPATWSERSASTASRLQSTELAQASMIIRDLTRHAERSGKRLTDGEISVLETCMKSVSSELSLVLDISQDDARTLILETAKTEV
jgi:CarD family transcriptional regulator